MPSTSVATAFTGMRCPIEMGYGLVHGPNAAVAHVKMPGSITPPVGSRQTLNLGSSIFVGFVTNREYDPIEDESTIRMVDWRDRLHDVYHRAAYNMQESDGRYYHIDDHNWESQIRTYVTKDLGQLDFNNVQFLPANVMFNLGIGNKTLFSAYTILNRLAIQNNFFITAEGMATAILKQSYPLNLDWNNGSTTVANCVQQVVQKCGMQFTCYGLKNMHITVRGFPESNFSNTLVSGFGNLCSLGVSSGKIGEELNEQGRRIFLIGERNKYEFIFGCRANWNPAWTWGMAFGGIELAALLKSHGLTVFSKVKDLPVKYHDNETWSENDNAGEGALPLRKTRNEMLIQDYIEKIVYKAYVIDARSMVLQAKLLVQDDIQGTYTRQLKDFPERDLAAAVGPLKNFPKATGYDTPLANFVFPISKNLITDTNLQYLVYASSRSVIRGDTHPFGVQYSLVPKSQGVSLDTEEVVNPATGQAEYRVRVFFNQPQFWLPPGKPFDDPTAVEPDWVLVRLSLDGRFYTYEQGEKGMNLRVREQAVTVRNLYDAYVNGNPVTVLRENFRRDIQKGGQALAAVPVRADDIAKRIATQLLMHKAITTSGSLTYEDICGACPDGIIESVNVQYTATDGITETVNFTSGVYDDKEISNPFALKLSRPFRNEEEVIRDRLIAIARAGGVGAGGAAPIVRGAMTLVDTATHTPGSELGVPSAALAYGRKGIVAIEYKKTYLEAITDEKALKGGTIILLDRPGA